MAEKLALVVEQLDRIASELESKYPVMALRIDQISDQLEGREANLMNVGRNIKNLLSNGWNWITNKAVNEPAAEKILKEYGVKWVSKGTVPSGYPGGGDIQYYLDKEHIKRVALWSRLRQRVLVPDRYWGNPVNINKEDVNWAQSPD